MKDFGYNYIKNKYGGRAGMALTDTDSLMCKIETENVYVTKTLQKQRVI